MKYPRIMISAGSSGSGKTLITCGLLRALMKRGLKVASFKCGPDYIDPMFHTEVIGTYSRNLDTFFTDENTTKYLFASTASMADISIMEGVMGFYDGLAGISTKASAYDVANVTNTPVLLIVNAKGMSVSLIPHILGFLQYRKDHQIKGVILNQVSKMLYQEWKPRIEEECGIKVCGYVPKWTDFTLDSRHLGLIMPNEIEKLQDKLDAFAEVLEDSLEIEEIIKISQSVKELVYESPELPVIGEKIRIALAKDEAFCFMYEDNLELLRKMGAELIPFSPLHDTLLPDHVHGILLYGGYPELYAEKLSENKTMKESIYHAIKIGIPCMAECGGFMYLHKNMEDLKHNSYKMVGLLDADAYRTDRLGRFGYIELISQKEQMLGEDVGIIKGHEFHYFDSTSCGDAFFAKKPLKNKGWTCIQATDNLLAGFPHLYYYSNLKVPERFLRKCLKWKEKKWQNQL